MPGVPPNAISGLKKALKGIFRSGKKNKSTQAQPTQQPSDAAVASGAADAQQSPAAPAAISQSDKREDLPPTHQLATGQHGKPQEAVPTPEPNASDGPEAAEKTRNQELDKPDVSPTEPTSLAGRSEPVSALDGETEQRPDLPPKEDDFEEDARAADTIANQPQETERALNRDAQDSTVPVYTSDGAQPTHHTTTAQRLDPATMPTTDGATETALTNGVSTDSHGAPETERPAASVATQQPSPTVLDEKMPVMAEPPQIPAVRTAPGMSATSGPLEDFPEGGADELKH